VGKWPNSRAGSKTQPVRPRKLGQNRPYFQQNDRYGQFRMVLFKGFVPFLCRERCLWLSPLRSGCRSLRPSLKSAARSARIQSSDSV
jgi:hypothetical protein